MSASLQEISKPESFEKMFFCLPFRHPTPLIDEVTYFEPDKFITATKLITAKDSDFFGIKQESSYPGTLILESMIQTGTIIATYKNLTSPYGGNPPSIVSELNNVRYFYPATVGDLLFITVEVYEMKPYIWSMTALANTESDIIAEANLHFTKALKKF